MARAIVDILNDADRRQSLARSAQTFVRTYDADWTVSQFEAIYQKVTGGKAAWGPNEPSCEVKLAKSRPI
jgi:hypothetical protein